MGVVRVRVRARARARVRVRVRVRGFRVRVTVTSELAADSHTCIAPARTHYLRNAGATISYRYLPPTTRTTCPTKCWCHNFIPTTQTTCAYLRLLQHQGQHQGQFARSSSEDYKTSANITK